MAPGSSEVRHIAIVTTDEAVLPEVEKFFAPNFHTTFLNNPDDILPLLTQVPLDAILLDVDTVPGSTTQGLEVLQELRGMSADFVLIALTRSHSHSLRRKATEAGADDFKADEHGYEILTEPAQFEPVHKAIEAKGIHCEVAEVASIATLTAPLNDPAQIAEEMVTLIVQVNGRVRDRIEVAANIAETDARELALTSEKVAPHLGNGAPKKVIYVPGKLINIVA